MSEPVEWFLFPEGEFVLIDGELGRVRDVKLIAGHDWQWFGDRTVERWYEDGELVRTLETDIGRLGLRRECDDDGVRHYIGRLRCPWIVWAMFR